MLHTTMVTFWPCSTVIIGQFSCGTPCPMLSLYPVPLATTRKPPAGLTHPGGRGLPGGLPPLLARYSAVVAPTARTTTTKRTARMRLFEFKKTSASRMERGGQIKACEAEEHEE